MNTQATQLEMTVQQIRYELTHGQRYAHLQMTQGVYSLLSLPSRLEMTILKSGATGDFTLHLPRLDHRDLDNTQAWHRQLQRWNDLGVTLPAIRMAAAKSHLNWHEQLVDTGYRTKMESITCWLAGRLDYTVVAVENFRNDDGQVEIELLLPGKVQLQYRCSAALDNILIDDDRVSLGYQDDALKEELQQPGRLVINSKLEIHHGVYIYQNTSAVEQKQLYRALVCAAAAGGGLDNEELQQSCMGFVALCRDFPVVLAPLMKLTGYANPDVLASQVLLFCQQHPEQFCSCLIGLHQIRQLSTQPSDTQLANFLDAAIEQTIQGSLSLTGANDARLDQQLHLLADLLSEQPQLPMGDAVMSQVLHHRLSGQLQQLDVDGDIPTCAPL